MNENSKMAELLAEAELANKPLNIGDMVEGTVLYLGKDNCLLDLGIYGTGMVSGKDLAEAHSSLVGAGADPITAIITDLENEEGYIALSLRRASREKIWDVLDTNMKSGSIIEVTPSEANRGGLLIEYEGIKGFLPVSQLSAENYPRVQNGDKEEILQRLKSLIGQKLSVRVLDVDRREVKLIFSEKEAVREKTQGIISKLKQGSKVTGLVTGIVDFGIFVNVDGVEGLVHISEIDWSRVLSPKDYAEVGQEIETQVLSIDGDKVSLSLKRLKDDPWLAEIKKFKEGDIVSGSITRVTPFGVFVDIGTLEALAHVSEIKEDDEELKLDELYEQGQTHEFKVLTIEPEMRKIFLTKKGLGTKAKVKSKAPKAAVVKTVKKAAKPKKNSK